MRKLIYETMFEKMIKIGLIKKDGTLNFPGDHLKLKNSPYMDLNIDVLPDDQTGAIRISMAHNFIQNDDLMADPDMEIRIYSHGMVEALTYQLDSLGIYQVVYPAPGRVIPKRKTELNRFLNQWLSNLIDQGFKYTPDNEGSLKALLISRAG
jgi:hypothetical protein